jgi:hypothetical protein
MIRLQTGGIIMDYDKIIIDLLNRIVTLEEKVAKLETAGTVVQANDMELP